MVVAIAKSHVTEIKYPVQVDDNYHFTKKEYRYTLGVFDIEEDAVRAAKR